MTDVKFLAAKELIKEGHYDEARGVLRTIDHPTALKWLQRIDELDPPFPHVQGKQAPYAPRTVMPTASTQGRSHQDKYYERENRRARLRDIGNGIYIILMGFMCLAVWAFFSGLLFGIPVSTGSFEGSNLLMFCVGVVAIFLGFIRM